MKIGLTLNGAGTYSWPGTIKYCAPILVENTGKERVVVILSPKGVLYFHPEDNTITYGDIENLRVLYSFIRYLEKGESLNITV